MGGGEKVGVSQVYQLYGSGVLWDRSKAEWPGLVIADMKEGTGRGV